MGAAVGLGAGYWAKARSLPPLDATAPNVSSAAPAQPHASAAQPVSQSGKRMPVAAADLLQGADPRAWLEAWSQAGAPPEQLETALAAIALWSETDPLGALDFIARAPRFPQRNRARLAPLLQIAKRDLPSAIAWIKAHLSLDERDAVASSLVHSLSLENPITALELAFAPDIPVQRDVIVQLVTTLAQTQPTKAMEYFNRLSEQGRRDAAGGVASAWFALDREAALRWCAEQRTQPYGSQAAAGIFEAAANAGPEVLQDTISRLGLKPEEFTEQLLFSFRLSPDAMLAMLPYFSAEGRQIAVERIVEEEMLRDPALALKLARESLPAAVATATVKEAWLSWLRSDAPAARAWAESVADPAIKTELQTLLAEQEADKDPTAFLTLAASSGAGTIDSRHISRAISAMNDMTPAEAAAWISRLPGTTAPGVVRDVARSWLERDEQAAWQWVSTQPASPTRDAALAGSVQHWVARNQLDNATAAVGAISDPAVQTSTRLQIATSLYRQNPERAQSWLATQPISQEARDTLFALLKARL